MNLRFPDLPANHPANNVPEQFMKGGDGRFEPKLTFTQRCGAAAALLIGYSSRHVAAAFSLNRRTVTKFLPDGHHYQPLRNELSRLGKVAFIDKYFTQDIMSLLTQSQASPDIEKSTKTLDKEAKSAVPNPRAKGSAGISVYQGPRHAHSYRIEIGWYEPEFPANEGWWVKQLDIEGIEDQWMGDEDGNPFATSRLAYIYARRWLDENELTA